MDEILKKAFLEQETAGVKVKKSLKELAEDEAKKEKTTLTNWVSLAIAERLFKKIKSTTAREN